MKSHELKAKQTVKVTSTSIKELPTTKAAAMMIPVNWNTVNIYRRGVNDGVLLLSKRFMSVAYAFFAFGVLKHAR